MSTMPTPVPGSSTAGQIQRIKVSPEIEAILTRLTHVATGLLSASAGVISLIGEDGEQAVGSAGLEARYRDAPAVSWASSFWPESDVATAHDPVVIMDARHVSDHEPSPFLPLGDIVSLVAVPLLSERQRIGTLVIGDAAPRGWGSAEIQALQQLAAVAVAALGGGVGTQVPAARPLVSDPQVEQAVARLRRSFEGALVGQAVAAGDGSMLACNAEFARIAGFASIAQAITANLNQLEHEPGAFRQLLERLKVTPLIAREELCFVRRDGTHARVLARLAATAEPNGTITEVRVNLVDITDRAALEDDLRRRLEQLSVIEVATHDVLWDWDLRAGTFQWNDTVARRFRYRPEEVQATPDWHLERIHPDDRERVMRNLERAALGVDSVWSDEYRLMRGDGSYATVLDRAHIVRDGRGEPVRIVGVILDITEVKSSEEAQRFLANASAVFESALDVESTATNLAHLCVPVLADICLVDLKQADGSMRRVAAAHRDHEREASLGVGRTWPAETCVTSLCGTAAVESHVDSTTLARLGLSGDASMTAYTLIPLEARGHQLGTIIFGLTGARAFGRLDLRTARDLAQRAGTALDNALLYATAQRAVEARNEVLGVVSHDLRVPLNTMMATLSLLSDALRERRKDTRDWFDILYRATLQMRMLIEDLLDASRMESDHLTLNRCESSVGSFIAEACEMLRPSANRKHIVIETDVPDSLPALSVDTPKLVRVVANLIGNAIKFSRRESTIRVTAVELGNEVQVSVRDQGEGIAQDQLSHVFDRFWSGHVADRRGTGLGLTIAKGIIEAHGGRIWVSSRQAEGSTFTFALPVYSADADWPPVAPQTPADSDVAVGVGL